MNRRPVVVYVPPSGRNVLVRGHDRRDLAGVPGMFSKRDRGLWVHRDRLADVLARLEVAGRPAELIEGEVR